MKHRLIIKNGTVLTLSEKHGNFQQADVLIEDGEIVSVASKLPVNGAEVVDASDMIVMPGFVDAHRHLWHAHIRGLAMDMALVEFFEKIPGKLGSRYRPQDLYVGNLLGALEAINAGITTVMDWSNIIHTPDHADEAVYALQDSGIRGVFTYSLPSEITFEHKDIERLKTTHFSSTDQLLTLALGVISPEYVPIEIVRRDIEFARELGVLSSMHTGSGGTHGGVKQLADASLLGSDLNFAHCNTLRNEEYKLITNCGGSVTITPEIEMQMGLGMPATRKVLESGGRPSLGVDVVTAVSGDLFTQMRVMLQQDRAQMNEAKLQDGEMPDSLRLTARDVIEFATIEGARSLDLEHKVGTLESGKKADIIFIRKNDLNVFPTHNLEAAILHANASNVDSVFIEGRAVKRHGKILHHDLDHIQKLAKQSYEFLLA